MVSVDRWSLCKSAIVLPEWLTDQRIVVSVDRWSLCKSAIVLPEWLTDQRIVVSIDRGSLKQVSLYVCTTYVYYMSVVALHILS